MKTAIAVIGFFCATAAFGQTVLSNTAQPYRPPDHVARAVQHDMGEETSLLSAGSYTYAKGEVPLAELASPMYQTPLGDVARENKKEHAEVPKAAKVFED